MSPTTTQARCRVHEKVISPSSRTSASDVISRRYGFFSLILGGNKRNFAADARNDDFLLGKQPYF